FAIATAVVAVTFALVWHVVIRQLPFPEAERLVFVWNRYGAETPESAAISAPDFADRRNARAFESSAIVESRGVILNAGEAQRLNAAVVYGDFYRVLGVQPALGVLPAPDEPEVVVLSDGAWRRHFGERRDLIDKTIVINDRPRRVAAVMPRGFAFPTPDIDVYMPLRLAPAAFADDERGNEYYMMLARLRPGVTVAKARAEMQSITAAVLNRVPSRTGFLKQTKWHVDVFSMREDLVRRARPALLMLFGAGLLVMLLATANVMGLFVARTASRAKEIAVRQALGAGRLRLAGELSLETILLALCGTALGVLLARAAMPFVAETRLPRIEEVRIDAGVIGFALLVAILTSLCIGAVISAWTFRHRALDATRGGTAPVATTRLRSLLVAAQIAIAVMLLCSGGLLVESYRRLRRIDVGFDTQRLLTFRIELPRNRYEQPPQRRALFAQLQERLGALPTIQSSGLVTDLPFSPSDWTATFDIPGRDDDAQGTPAAHFRVMTPGYTETMGIPVLRGRAFTSRDREGTAEVVIIDEAAARKYWPNQNPIGKRLDFGDNHKGMEIVGVVGSVRENAVDAAAEPHVYLSINYTGESSLFGVVRTKGDPARVAADLRAVIRSLDPAQPVFGIRTMEEYLDDAVAQPRLRAAVVALSASVAVLLALIGLYGLIAYVVTARTREVGVRMALGASATNIARSVLAWALRLAAFGVLAGVAGAFFALRSIRAFFTGVEQLQTGMLAAVAIGFLCTALIASVTPALRAARTDPASALRHE
ncbi:MAG TPA: ABC transporter permease, partial [Thermoanaerobaculia bacterium]|nr:ABC transporter permease [Thermoanaerobaculia bacterium]